MKGLKVGYLQYQSSLPFLGHSVLGVEKNGSSLAHFMITRMSPEKTTTNMQHTHEPSKSGENFQSAVNSTGISNTDPRSQLFSVQSEHVKYLKQRRLRHVQHSNATAARFYGTHSIINVWLCRFSAENVFTKCLLHVVTRPYCCGFIRKVDVERFRRSAEMIF